MESHYGNGGIGLLQEMAIIPPSIQFLRDTKDGTLYCLAISQTRPPYRCYGYLTYQYGTMWRCRLCRRWYSYVPTVSLTQGDV